MDPNGHGNLFRYNTMCLITLITWKLQVVYGCSTYWTTALQLEMSIFCVRTECEIWLVSYGSKHALQSVSDKPFVCTYMHNLKLQVIHGCSAYQTTALLFETFFVWFRVASEILLDSYGPRHTSVVLWYKIVCILQARKLASLYIHRYLICNYIHMTTNSCTLWLDTTHQTTVLLPTMHLFIWTKLASYTTVQVTVSFQLIVYINIKITKRYTTILFYVFAAKQW